MLSKRFIKRVAPVFLCITFLTVSPPESHADEAKTRLTLAVLPCYDPIRTFKKFHLLAAYLKAHSGCDIEIVVPTELEKIRVSLQNGDIDFILQDPHTYVLMENLLNRSSIVKALAADGSSLQTGLIIARKGSGIKGLEDLRGKSFMFGSELSIVKWIGAREALKEKRIDIDKDLKAYSHGGCCEDIAFTVFLKAVDAGAVCGDFFDDNTNRRTELGIDLDQIVVIGRTAPFPSRVFAARQGIDDEILTKVIQALLNLSRENPEHAKILGPVEVGGFQESNDRDYASIRALVGETPL